MDLSGREENRNLLPYDGEVIYIGKILSRETANDFFNILLSSIPWKHDEVKIFGKHIITKRKVAWYADGVFLTHIPTPQKKDSNGRKNCLS